MPTTDDLPGLTMEDAAARLAAVSDATSVSTADAIAAIEEARRDPLRAFVLAMVAAGRGDVALAAIRNAQRMD